MRGRDAPVSAVSEPEKKPDNNNKTMIAMMIRMTESLMSGRLLWLHESSGNRAPEDGFDVAEIDIARDKSFADCARQYEYRSALAYLFVSADQRYQALNVPLSLGMSGRLRR